ncbi:MAG: ISKra4 family transposase [Gammaproteobacteria bacterium]
MMLHGMTFVQMVQCFLTWESNIIGENMRVAITSKSTSFFTLKIDIPYSTNMLEAEEGLQQCLNAGGMLATKELMELHDTDGSPIMICGNRLTSKGKESKEFQTPYGAIDIFRHVYQRSSGGKTHIPLDIGCRIINTSTPKFAKMVSSKYACDGAPGVQRDLAENHNREVALSFIKNTTDAVGAIAEAKEESWSYALPEMPKTVKTVSIGLDGTCLNMIEDGWREAMCGTIALFDRSGERMHTTYVAASPEYGKATFLKKLSLEVDKIVDLFPQAKIVGLADGAASNWTFLSSKADYLLIDFWHVTEYLSKAATVIFKNKDEREEWLDSTCHRLKHKSGGVTRILSELIDYKKTIKFSREGFKILESTITYLENNKEKMKYHIHVSSNMPIGSGVTEAACKTLVKQRMCKGSARWKDQGATTVLTLRSLHLTNVRWDQFWEKYSRYGYQDAA